MEHNLRVVSSRDLRGNLSEMISRVTYGGERVGVSRNGKPAVVMVSVEDYELLEALEALEDDADAKAYLEAKRHDDGERHSVGDLRNELGL